jgi:four helix bundle protein
VNNQNTEKKSENVIQTKSFEFSLVIIRLYKELIKRNEYILSKQLLRSGTSIGANIEEATAAISRKDFIHKLSIASKEARESRYWLKLLKQGNLVEDLNFDKEIQLVEEINRILTSIIKTSTEKE